MEGIKSDSPSARLIAEALGDEPFTVIDVGCAGGIDQGWTVFGDRLRAFAFDASRPEIARLRLEEKRPGVEYVAAKVGLHLGGPLDHEIPAYNWWRRNPWDRLAVGRAEKLREIPDSSLEDSCAAAWVWPVPDPLRALPPGPLPPSSSAPPFGTELAPPILPTDAKRHRALMAANRWSETETASDALLLHLPSFLESRGVTDVDFVKIDVDGPDYGILISLEQVYGTSPVLGVTTEVNFFGNDAPHHHTFHNTDRYLRGQGFDLYGLTVRPYASAALPRRYASTHAGVSTSGRPIQGDAFYARDTAWKGQGEIGSSLSAAKLLKLAAIFALFDLVDQAAELVIRHRGTFAERLDVQSLLDSLTEEAWPGLGLKHAELITRFDADDAMFYPSPATAAPCPSSPDLRRTNPSRRGGWPFFGRSGK